MPDPRPDDAALADAAGAWVGAYLHIPFCRRVCPYCDFAVIAGADDLRDRYVAALIKDIERAEPLGRGLDAVSFGGGTPSRIDGAAMASIVDALASHAGLAAGAEVSLEANPEDWTDELAADLVAGGFTRVSFGVQSFDPSVLAALGRMHDPAQAVQAVESARGAGFSTVNVDLIFGTPGESLGSWRASIDRALSLDIDHLSTYALTVERGTPLSRAVASGAPAPDPDLQADMWELAAASAAEAGLVRYETSNHARPGSPCRYNLLTWAQGDYLAFGAAAHGHRAGVRTRNVRRVDRYLEAIEEGASPVQGLDRVEGWAAEQERLLLGLRRAAGVRAGTAGARLVEDAWGSRLVEAGVLSAVGDRLVASKPLLGDEISRAVLALDAAEC